MSGIYKYLFNVFGETSFVNVNIFTKVAYDITSGAKYGLNPTLINDCVIIPRNKYRRHGIPLKAAACNGDN